MKSASEASTNSPTESKKAKMMKQSEPGTETQGKKEMKKASKLAAKAKKASNADGSNSFSSPKEVKVFCDNAIDILKILIAAAMHDIIVTPLARNENPCEKYSFSKSCVLLVDDQFIFGANSICQYFSYAAASPDTMPDCDDETIYSFIEWSEGVVGNELLQGVESMLAKVNKDSSLKINALFGESLTIADAVLLPRVLDAFRSMNTDVSALYPRTQTYVSSLKNMPQIEKSVLSVDDFLNVCNPELSTESCTANDLGLCKSIQQIFTAAIKKSFPQLGDIEATIIKCTQYKHGDFQCNSAMSLFPILKQKLEDPPKSPQEVAKTIVLNLPKSSKIIESTSLSGPGFINLRLKYDFLSQGVQNLVKNGPSPPKKDRLKIVVDFSGPNIAKEMHVGHLRSTIIGDTICRMLEFCGHDVMRVNHLGDWGTQFGMLINHMKTAYPNFINDPPTITDLTTFYKQAKNAFDESEAFKDISRKTVVKLQSGDKECLEVWNLLCKISRTEFQKVYDRLNVDLEECGESFYNPIIPETLQRMNEKGILRVEDGATVCMLENFTYPLIVRKSDGGYGYDSTDMTAIDYRLNKLKANWIIYITDIGQRSHFDMVFEAAKACGWVDNTQRLEHVGFGVVQGEDGKKFKSRSGDTVRLVDLLDEAVKRMYEILKERVETGKSPLSLDKVSEAASAIGYGAVKYFDLRQHPSTSYSFSYDRMLDTRGNTAVYLQFAHARLCSIIRKAEQEQGVNMDELIGGNTPITLEHEAERALAFELMQFTDVLEEFLRDLLPHRVCEYLYNLSTKFTDFVTNCHVLNSAEKNSRLLLCQSTAVVMRKAMELLGLTPLHQI